jgi:hypothetical protein
MRARKRPGPTPDEEPDRAHSFWYVLLDVLHGAKVGAFEHEDGVLSISRREWTRTFYRSQRKAALESAERAWERFKIKAKKVGVCEKSLDSRVLCIHMKRAGDAIFEKLGPPHIFEKLGPPHPTKENRRER